MRKRSVTVTGLDIGSSKISAVSAEIDAGGVFNITGQAACPSRGVSRGALTNLDEATDSVTRTLSKLTEKIRSKALGNIYVNINGEDLMAERSKGMIPLSVRGREITNGDIERCVNVASTIQLPFDRDIIHKITHNFSIDDQPSIKNPLGLYASRLACEMYVITANINHIQNIYKCVNGAGYNVREAVFSGIADGMSILSEQEKEDGALLLNIGASLTGLSIFHGGVLSKMDVMPLGMKDFKGDLRDDPGLNDIVLKVKARTEEFLKRGGRVDFVKLTGGAAFTDDIIETLEEKLKTPVKVGIAKDVKGDISSVDNLRLTPAIGLIKYAAERYRTKALNGKNVVQKISAKVVDIFNNYF